MARTSKVLDTREVNHDERQQAGWQSGPSGTRVQLLGPYQVRRIVLNVLVLLAVCGAAPEVAPFGWRARNPVGSTDMCTRYSVHLLRCLTVDDHG